MARHAGQRLEPSFTTRRLNTENEGLGSARPPCMVGMRSRASGVARRKTVPTLLCLFPPFVRFFTFCERATPDARERIPTTPRASRAKSQSHSKRVPTLGLTDGSY